MIWLIGALAVFFASALVATCTGTIIAAGKHLDRSDREKREMFRVLTARLVTDELGPGAEYRALRGLQDAARISDTAALAADVDPLEALDRQIEGRRRTRAHDVAEGLTDENGRPVIPTGAG